MKHFPLFLFLIVVGTVFYPYFKMQAEWHVLKFKHWFFQTYSDIMLAQGHNLLKKAEILERLGDMDGALKLHKQIDVIIKKVREERLKLEATLEAFSEKYI